MKLRIARWSCDTVVVALSSNKVPGDYRFDVRPVKDELLWLRRIGGRRSIARNLRDSS